MPRRRLWTAKLTLCSLGQRAATCCFDLGTGVGVDDDDDVVEARGPRVRGEEVDDALAVLADGCQLLDPAVAPGATGGEDDE